MLQNKINKIWNRQNWSEISFGKECYNQAIKDIEKIINRLNVRKSEFTDDYIDSEELKLYINQLKELK